MRERAERLGGMLAIESTPEGGTTVRATVIRRDYDCEIGAPAEAESAASL
jgi:nitrate/nitrite-specific signal transduction histidine kinase